MDDPRLDEFHLPSPRRERYQGARAGMLGCMGGATMDLEDAVRRLRLPFGVPPGPSRHLLQNLRTGHVHPLRLGINTIGRHPDNDIVLLDFPISRRHCVLLIHTSGRCEVHDTASRNGTRIGHQNVTTADLKPGDVLRLCDCKFVYRAPDVAGNADTDGDGTWPDPTLVR